jgi:branched-chain amino acid transport system substrate-binding protein
MGAIMHAIGAQRGKLDPDRTMALHLLKTDKAADSPRGPLSIDPETRDVAHDEYRREARKIDGQVANVDLETVVSAVIRTRGRSSTRSNAEVLGGQAGRD